MENKMTKLKEVYKCNICGNIVEVLHTGAGELVCCGQPMELLVHKKEEEGKEKHLPVIEENRVYLDHPSTEDHYIEWIEFDGEETSCKKFFAPGDKPEVSTKGRAVTARAYCNIHGLWKS